jgi:hypothetical protein
MNSSEYTTISFGGSYAASEAVKLFADATWIDATESLDQLSYSMDPDVAAILVHSSYDLSPVHTYSDLDSRRWELNLRGEFKVWQNLFGVASYTYLNFDDLAPYLDDLTGTLNEFNLGLRWIL